MGNHIVVEKKISEFRVGDTVQGNFYVRESEMKQTTTNNKYMNFTFSDKSGEINAKFWDWDEDNATRFRAGVVVKARGQVIDWQGQLQFKIERIRRTIETDQIKMEDLIPSAPESGESMLAYIESVVDRMQDTQLQTFVRKVIDLYRTQLLIYPAAKRNHHAVRCGLLYHVSTMLKAAEALTQVYGFLNKDLLYTGVILHDIGKISEMNVNACGLVSEYSAERMLLGHLIEGVKLVGQIGAQTGLDSEKILLIEHMILSHHYLPEHGSPKFPMFPEAEMLHYLDIVDARMYDMAKVSEATEPGCFSDRIWSLDNRVIYRSTIDKT